ncbi:MAG: hypothetical protein RL226_1110 [Bacteroidota bacterium]
MKTILVIVGTRPNFIKVTRFCEVGKQMGVDVKILHTGQHYDRNMSTIFFDQFGIRPDYMLDLESTGAAGQMGETILGIEKVVSELSPDLMVVVGDVNSTLAGAIAANKLGIKLAHVESGLRSFDRTMPEEINRILTDEITDVYFVTEQSGLDHLLNSGINPDRMHFVGNTMIDTMVAFQEQIERSDIRERIGLTSERPYALMTFHRPALVDSETGLQLLIEILTDVSEHYNMVLPIHPRTRKNLAKFGLLEAFEAIQGLITTEPIGYFEFQNLINHAAFILTDSGGIQEETTFRRIPCLTLRPNTERPVTVELGTNLLAPLDRLVIREHIRSIREGRYKKGSIPPLWDGKSTERIMQIIASL